MRTRVTSLQPQIIFQYIFFLLQTSPDPTAVSHLILLIEPSSGLYVVPPLAPNLISTGYSHRSPRRRATSTRKHMPFKSNKDAQVPSFDVNTEVTYTPFTDPSPESSIPDEPTLTSEQKEKYKFVLEHFQNTDLVVAQNEDDKKNSTGSSAEKGFTPLTHDEKAWLTRECFLRYLRTTNWDKQDAVARLLGTLVWRREYGISNASFDENSVNSDLVAEENETGKEFILGYDNDSRPCLYLKPGRQNTKSSPRQIQLVVYLLERTIDFMPSGQDTLLLLIDFKSSPVCTVKEKLPPVNIGRQVLHILQTHYPERLGKALFINIPFLAWMFLKVIYPFIDPVTRQKLVFDQPLPSYVPLEQLDKDFGGKVNFDYDHAKYWLEMHEIVRKKKERYMKRFDEFGAQVGLSELDLRGSDAELKIPVDWYLE